MNRLCDICYQPAIGYHHITPLMYGGLNEPINKVPLCKYHHDIVEAIYQERGLLYTPYLKTLIRLEYDLPQYLDGLAILENENHTPAYNNNNHKYPMLATRKLTALKIRQFKQQQEIKLQKRVKWCARLRAKQTRRTAQIEKVNSKFNDALECKSGRFLTITKGRLCAVTQNNL